MIVFIYQVPKWWTTHNSNTVCNKISSFKYFNLLLSDIFILLSDIFMSGVENLFVVYMSINYRVGFNRRCDTTTRIKKGLKSTHFYRPRPISLYLFYHNTPDPTRKSQPGLISSPSTAGLQSMLFIVAQKKNALYFSLFFFLSFSSYYNREIVLWTQSCWLNNTLHMGLMTHDCNRRRFFLC